MVNYFVARGETQALNEARRASLRGSFLRLSSGVTHYELAGPRDGDVVLLVPGLTIPLFYWDDFAARLHKQGLRTLAYSAYGRGYSDRLAATYDRDFFLRQARELLASLKLDRVSHVVGTSMGALLAMALLHQEWFKAKTLTLVGPAGLESRVPLVARLSRWHLAELVGRRVGQRKVLQHVDLNVRSEEHVEKLRTLIYDAFRFEGSVYALFATLAAFPLTNQQELFRSTGDLQVPTMLVWGLEDRITPIDKLPTVHELLRPAECHVVPMCGHMAPFEQPDAVAAHFASFVSKQAQMERAI